MPATLAQARAPYPGPVAHVEEAERVERVPRWLWDRLRAEPDRAPELIALAAAEQFAPPAERWAKMMLAYEPPEKVARTAYKKHVRLSRVEGAALGLGGAFTAAADLVALAWIQGRMTFFIAAAHGFDPRHPMRPAELLTLQGIYPTAAEARAALDGVGKHMALQYIDSRRGEGELVPKLLKLVARKVAKRSVTRLVPLLSSPVAAVQNARATADLGTRALKFYGG